MQLVPYAVLLGQNEGASPFLCKIQADFLSEEQISEANFTRCIYSHVFFMLRVHFKSHSPIWLHFLRFGSCPRAVSRHSESHRNDTKLRDVILLPATRQPIPGISVEPAPKVQQLAEGATCHLLALGVCFSCTAWPGNPDLVSALPAEVQLPAEHSPGSCICDRFLTLARMYRNTESSPTSRFCGWLRPRFDCLCKSEMTSGTVRP